MAGGDGIHWPSVRRAATGFLAVMAIGWTLAWKTGWDWLIMVAMVPAGAAGYWWANRYEQRAGIEATTEQTSTELATRLLLILIAGGIVSAIVQREWYLVTVGLVALGPVVRARATARRGAPGAVR